MKTVEDGRTRSKAAAVVLRLVGTLLIGAVAWAVLGYLATLPLGALFGWSGHPAMPAAPMAVYVALYAVVLPVACLIAGWIITGRIEARLRHGGRPTV